MMWKASALVLLCLHVEAARIEQSWPNLHMFDHTEADKAKDNICGSDTITDELNNGESVDSIRGIQWNAISKTAKQFIAFTQADIDTLKVDLGKLEIEMAELVAKRDAAKVKTLDFSEIQALIAPAVTAAFGGVTDAQDKLCWGGGMEPIELANQRFEAALAEAMEYSRTDVTAVQEACLGLLIKKKHDINMCDELCNSMGRTAAKVAAEAKRVKAFINIEERITQVDTLIKAKTTQLRSLNQKILECDEDQATLDAHKGKLTQLSSVINVEKVNIFKARFALMNEMTNLADIRDKNKKMYIKTRQLEDALRKAGADKDAVKAALRALKMDEVKLNQNLQKQSLVVKNLDAKVKGIGSATETVIEFKSGLQRLLLIWTEYYMKSVVEPLQRVENLFPNASWPEIAELRARSDKTASGLSEFCKREETTKALGSVSTLPELSLICDKRLEDWQKLVADMQDHVEGRQSKEIDFINEMAQNLSVVEKKYAYKGPKLSGVRGEVEGVWEMRAFFYPTEFYKRYLKGWKAIDKRMITRLRSKGWKGSIDQIFDGKWMRLCENLDKAFDDAEKSMGAGKKALQNIVDQLDALMEEVDKVKDELTRAEGTHALAADMARTANEELDKIKGQKAELEGKVAGLKDQHAVSLEALRKAEHAYVGTHEKREVGRL